MIDYYMTNDETHRLFGQLFSSLLVLFRKAAPLFFRKIWTRCEYYDTEKEREKTMHTITFWAHVLPPTIIDIPQV